MVGVVVHFFNFNTANFIWCHLVHSNEDHWVEVGSCVAMEEDSGVPGKLGDCICTGVKA